MSSLTIYKASAGSGKTFKLTEQYLMMLLSAPSLYKNILAVTFTNKATTEMKTRILAELNNLSKGKLSEHKESLKSEINITDSQIKDRASQALRNILHDYSRFSISTIDHFFQRVIRTFAREMGLQSGYTLETDDSEILTFVIDQVLLATEEDKQLKDWLVDFALSRIQEGKSWDFKDAVRSLADELSKEHVKELNVELSHTLNDKDKLRSAVQFLKQEEIKFENNMSAIGKKGVALIESNQLSVDDFYQKKRGPANYFYQLAAKNKYEPNSYVYKVLDDTDKLPGSSADKSIKQQIESIADQFLNVLQEAVEFYENNSPRYFSMREITRNIYVLGILMDIQKRIDEYCREKNLFLISDASDLLRKIIDKNDTPFVYEKTGSRFRHFLIDEFQDTSRFQWENFIPLISNSLGENGRNLLVGDVKQSIYRWRNSDWKILSDEVDDEFSAYEPNIKHLENNFRSLENIIAFNNTIFSYAPLALQNQFNRNIEEAGLENPWQNKINEVYSDVHQASPFHKEGGYVYTEFFSHESRDKNTITENIKNKVIRDIEMLQDKGYELGDIALIVRKNNEGQELANAILEYKNNNPSSFYKYDVISNDSLFISSAESVKFILAVFRYFVNPDDNINKAFLVETYHDYILNKAYGKGKIHDLFKDQSEEAFSEVLPGDFFDRESELRKMPLFELTDQLILLFGIDKLQGEITYLQAFQNMILNFSRRYAADLNTFLEWWDEKGWKEKLQLPENYNAIRIVTIHKAKGLEFKAVIIPFCNWEIDESSSGFKTNYLWPQPRLDGLDKIKYVPVNYKKALSNTIFAEDYYAEQFHNYVDNLNLLYVAGTRAEEILICYVPLRLAAKGELNYKKKNEIEKVGELLHFIMENAQNMNAAKKETELFIDNIESYWDSEKQIFEMGRLEESAEKIKIKENNLILDSYAVFEKTPSLKLSYDHETYFKDTPDLFSEKIDYGKIMHRVFEYIHTPNDIPKAVEMVYLQGKISKEEKAGISSEIQNIIEDEKVHHFFSDQWEIYTEREILLPSGNIYRPDRVMMSDKETIVLDYKFGEKKQQQHKKKVSQYLNQIKKMGYPNPKGFVWYVNQMEVVNV